jgi:hypothetical protein
MYKAWRATTVGMTLAQALLNKAMAMNPFGIIAIAIGVVITAIVLLIMNWDSVVKFLAKTWKWIKDIFGKGLSYLVDIVKKRFESIKQSVVGVWNGIVSFFKNGVERIKSIFQTITSTVTTVFENVWTNIKSAFERISSLFTTFKEGLKSVFSGIWEFIKAPLNMIITGINFFIKGYENMINNVINGINSIPDIKLPGWLGGKEFGIPDLGNVSFSKIPALAEGGTITKAGTVMVGEQGPEFLNLPRGAEVVPLDKQQQQTVVVNINNPKVFNDKDAEKLGDLLVRSLKLKGVQTRGV